MLSRVPGGAVSRAVLSFLHAPSRSLFCAIAWLAALLLLAGSTLAAAGPELRFLRAGTEVNRLPLSALREACPVERIAVDDPFYGRRKSFYALPASCALELGLGALPAPGQNLFLRAADGYVRPTSFDDLRAASAWIAFADADLTPSPEAEPQWEPIDRRQVDPGPFYMVWGGAGQSDPHRYPWPYQLIEIELAPLELEYPHVVPDAAPGSPADRGFALFRRECIACHAINGEGGKVGPDLNVPQSIVEYRPVEQIRAYILDPASFRFSSMPSHRHLKEEDLDALIAYFRAMARRKYIPRADP